MKLAVFYVTIIVLAGKAFASSSIQDDLDVILRGVNFVSRDGHTPGLLTLESENAFPVLAGNGGSNIRHAIVAASHHGDGRVIVFSHTSCFHNGGLSNNNTLFVNSVVWASGDRTNISGAIPSGSLDTNNIRTLLERNNIPLTTVPIGNLANKTFLKEFDFFVVNWISRSNLNREILVALEEYVREGGALILGGTSWSDNPPSGENHSSFFGNRILQHFGSIIQFTPSYAYETASGGWSASREQLVDIHAKIVWAEVHNAVNTGRKIPQSRALQLTEIIKAQLRYGLKDINKADIQTILVNLITTNLPINMITTNLPIQ